MQQRINLNLRVAQKQVLTPGLVQMVSVLALNKLELRDMITNEMVENPVLEELADGEMETDAEEVARIEEIVAAEDRGEHAADREITQAQGESSADAAQSAFEEYEAPSRVSNDGMSDGLGDGVSGSTDSHDASSASALDGDHATDLTDFQPAKEKEKDAFEEIDFGSFFDDYLDPGYRSPASEDFEKPSFENFLATPTNLTDHLLWQLSLTAADPKVVAAAEAIIGNLNEDGYLTVASMDDLAAAGPHATADVEAALILVQQFDPVGVGARDLRECLLIQLRTIGMEGSCAWQVVSDYLPQVQNKQWKEIAKALGKPIPVVEESVEYLKRLDPRPGQRYNKPDARLIEPDVFIVKNGDEYHIIMNEEDVPQLRLNLSYRRLLNRGESDKDVRTYIKDRYSSAIQLMKNIEQRKQTILRVCQTVVQRQKEFLDHGIDELKPMMIKEVAEEVGVHPSTVSRAVANKYVHTPQGVYELRFFFSEAVQGPSGQDTSLLVLKRKVKKIIEEEDSAHPLTDDQITRMLQTQGIQVTRRTVAKYREDMRIPSTHQRRVKVRKVSM
jgi:RNA polymerase sigma-54 factor